MRPRRQSISPASCNFLAASLTLVRRAQAFGQENPASGEEYRSASQIALIRLGAADLRCRSAAHADWAPLEKAWSFLARIRPELWPRILISSSDAETAESRRHISTAGAPSPRRAHDR